VVFFFSGGGVREAENASPVLFNHTSILKERGGGEEEGKGGPKAKPTLHLSNLFTIMEKGSPPLMRMLFSFFMHLSQP